MSRPFAEVFAALPSLNRTYQRTLDRDLTMMSRVARELARVGWRPKPGGAPIMNFNNFTAGVKDGLNDPDRMPRAASHLRVAFPIYTGGGGCAKRFKTAPEAYVGQDAAYWAPPLMVHTPSLVAKKSAAPSAPTSYSTSIHLTS